MILVSVAIDRSFVEFEFLMSFDTISASYRSVSTASGGSRLSEQAEHNVAEELMDHLVLSSRISLHRTFEFFRVRIFLRLKAQVPLCTKTYLPPPCAFAGINVRQVLIEGVR
jgi:hypothetical protein